jgi:predicted permease
MRGWFRRRLPLRPELDAELDEEIRLHLELRVEQLLRRGLSPQAARLEARRQFASSAAAWRSWQRAARRRGPGMSAWTDELRQDTGYVVRTVLREPAFSLVIILTLALGIGANAAMFGLIDKLLLRGPAHVERPGELVRFYWTVRRPDNSEFTSAGAGYVSYAMFRDGAHSFAGVAASQASQQTLGQGADAELVRVGAATADFFPLLGVQAARGRFFNAQEDRPPLGENVAVLGQGLWRRRFGGDPGVIGREIMLAGALYTVIGIAPVGFTGADLTRTDVWIPMSVVSRNVTANWPTAWNAQWLRVVARLKPGVSAAQASAEVTELHRRGYTLQKDPRLGQATVRAAPLRYNARGREPLEVSISRWLMGVTVIVLLVACANVTSLLLARSTRRRHEIAIRLALGTGRARLLRLLLLHGLVLSLAGGLLAVFVAHTGGRLLGSVLLPDIDWGASPISARGLVLTALVALAAGVLVSLGPALRAVRAEPAATLRTGQRDGGGRNQRFRAGLTIGQAALSVVLLVGAGLFVRSLGNVRGLHLGIEPERVLVGSASWPAPTTVTPETRAQQKQRTNAFYERALERVRGLPGVEAAALAVGTPFNTSFTIDLRVPGWDSIPEMKGGGPYVNAVTAGYFETVGTGLLAGRTFTPADRAGSEPVAIVSQTMARTLWPGESALGKCLFVNDDGTAPVPCSRVVGMVEDARRFGLREEPSMQYYIPLGQEAGFGGTNLLVRPRSTAIPMIPDLRRALADLDAGVQYIGIATLQESLDPQIRPWRLGAALFSMFGLLALLVAGIGLYSVVAYSVASRTHELGVRMALGARRPDVLLMVLWQGAGLAFAGVLLGLLLAFGSSRLLESILFEASPRDPAVFTGVAAITLLVAVLASLVPAGRAVRVDPLMAFRAQ